MTDNTDPNDTIAADIADAVVVPDDVPTPPPPPVVVQRRNGVPALVGGALAAVIGFGVAQFVPNGWPLQSTDALQADIVALQAGLAAAKDQTAGLQAEIAAAPVPDAALADRVAALETAPADTTTADRLTAIEKKLTTVGTTTGGGINVATSVLSAQADAIAALQADVAALKAGGTISPDIAAKLAEAEARATALAAQTEAEAMAARQRNALDRLDIALESGAPFATALADLGDAAIPAALADHAATGLPSLPTLQAAFPDAARAALDASLRATTGTSWTDRATSFLRSQTGARSLTPREGTDPDAVLSRADAAVAEGRITDAITETAALPAEGQAALAAWLEQANLYLTAQQAVADLRTALKVE
jgi:hypothetical protein